MFGVDGRPREAADLLGVACAVLLALAVAVLPVVRETPLRAVVALPVLLVGPGYALVAACYPHASALAGDGEHEGPDDPRLSALGRLALAIGGSVAVVGAVGLGAAALGAFRARTVLPGVGALTLALCGVAWYRRRRTHAALRYRPALGDARARLAAWSHGSRLDAALTVVAVVAVLGAAGGVYAHDAGAGGAADSTHAALLHAENGTAVAADYPHNLTVGAPANYTVAVGATDATNATVLAVLERYDANATRSDDALPTPVSRTELDRVDVAVPAGGEALASVTVRPDAPAERARLVFLVYHGAVPSDPTAATADDELHAWVRVDEGRGVSDRRDRARAPTKVSEA
ncbi:DUF1616 domain-containing protein (plasmid) [Halarchaeum sp. CBA1220]|uniref:DUF1616 domain-containing protein n=1 Tax=Halarchaeum sp. CBA1220 TaxID=1853682 RepID=UPI000F3A85BA|nr:DUF1616 domain-containing protein [Halarchaeum sp. CBA1220]QLC34904.1 DUF1616 domain-containing protein [Halarchaeum sp. CBA1220]